MIVYTSMKIHLSLVSTMRGLLLPLRRRRSAKHVTMRSQRRAYLTYAHVRLRLCRSLGGKASENSTLIGRRRFRLDPRAPPSEIVDAPLIAALILAYTSIPAGGWEKRKSIAPNGVSLALLPPRQIYHFPGSSPYASNTRLIVRNSSVPSPDGLHGQGAAFISRVPLR
jgi:hypothetical protein